MEITRSLSFKRMPRTPVELRPAKTRTSVTEKRMHLPLAAASSTSSSSPQGCTPINSPLSSSFMAILPLAIMLVKSDNALRLTVPCEVENITWSAPQLSSFSGKDIMVAIVSPSASGSRLTSDRPRACGVPSGRR